jgi:hypothetical protein
MSTYHPIPRHEVLCLEPGREPSPSWLCERLIKVFGTQAEGYEPPISILAKYQYTKDYADYACTVQGGVEDGDRVTIASDGLEIVVHNPWKVEDAQAQHYFVNGRMSIKAHNRPELLMWFYEKFSLWFFNQSKFTPYQSANEFSPSGTSAGIITFTFPVARERYGGVWKSRIVI